MELTYKSIDKIILPRDYDNEDMGEAYVTWQGVWGLLQIGLLRKIRPRR